MLHPGQGLNTIHVVGVGPEDALGLVLRKVFQNVLFFPDKTLPSTKSDLAVGVCALCDDERLQSFTKWAHDSNIPALCVDIRNDEALVGPLTLSGRAGCWRCAFERITAALASSEPHTEQTPLLSLKETSKQIAPLLVREMQAIKTDGLEQSQLLDHVLAVSTLDESLHKVVPLARCTVCGGAAAFPGATQERISLSPGDSPEVVLGALSGWVDRRTGVISNLFIEPPAELQVSLPIVATAAPPHVFEKDGSLRRLPLGWGKGLTISGAVLSAVGEAIERYSASLVDPERIVWKRPDELDGEFLDPGDCGLYSDEQYQRADFPYVRFDPDIPHPWTLGSWLHTGKPVWVPAIFVFLSIELRQEQLIAQGTSNGLAASTGKDDAALRAILELVERDAFMATWLTVRPAQRIQLDDTLDPLLRTVLEGIEALGASVEVYTLPLGVIGTTVLCLALGDGDQYPGITFGLGCDLDPHAALRQSVLELGQTGPYLRRMMQSKVLTAAGDPSGVREMLDHAAYYFPKERSSVFDRLRSENSTISLRDLKSVAKRSLEYCAAELEAAGVRVALIDVTSADVATGPFSVMRAVSPDLQPIWYGYGLDRTPVERVRKTNILAEIPPINPIW
jgi:ribosomal protein S12 methylthiotransferase accessory factor